MKGVMRGNIWAREGGREGQEASEICIMGSLEILYWSLNIIWAIQSM